MIGGVSHAQGELLAQVAPSVTTPVTIYTADELRTEITLITIALRSAMAIDLYHDDDGTTYDATTQLAAIVFGAIPALPDDAKLFQAQHPGSGIMIKPGGSLAVAIGTANDATINVYGITETLAERVRGI